MMKVVGGSASQMLAKELAGKSGFDLAKVEIRRFPDGECYVKIHEDFGGQEVVLVATTHPDNNIVEALLLQDAIRNSNAGKLTTVIPYFGYARQDKMFTRGEAVSARVLARHLGQGTDRLFTVDIHNLSVMPDFGDIAENVSAMPAIGQFLKYEGVDVILSPDAGSKGRAELAAGCAACPWDFLEKTRIDGETVEMRPKNLDVAGKTVAIVDDIIATGGTIVKAAEQLKEQGAERIIAACTHGLFTGGAEANLGAACDIVLSTDSIESAFSKLSLASTLADHI